MDFAGQSAADQRRNDKRPSRERSRQCGPKVIDRTHDDAVAEAVLDFLGLEKFLAFRLAHETNSSAWCGLARPGEVLAVQRHRRIDRDGAGVDDALDTGTPGGIQRV
jgi:hypothetical protein